MNREERIKSIKMSGKKCKLSNNDSIFKCHCNHCNDNIIEYLGKKKGVRYLYTGKFTPEYMRDKHVFIRNFCIDENDKTSSCECFIEMADVKYGCEWIPRKEIVENLIEINDTFREDSEVKK